MHVPLAGIADFALVVKLFLLVSSISIHVQLVKYEVEDGLQYENHEDYLYLVADVVVPVRVDISEPAFEH